MKVYETTFIINPQSDDTTIDRQVKAVSDLITSNGGTIIHEDRMGTRRLAYEINGLTQGYYTSIIFESEANLPLILGRHYRLEEPYVRYLTILYEGNVEELRERASSSPGYARPRPEPAVPEPRSVKAEPAEKEEPAPTPMPETSTAAKPEPEPTSSEEQESTQGSEEAPAVESGVGVQEEPKKRPSSSETAGDDSEQPAKRPEDEEL